MRQRFHKQFVKVQNKMQEWEQESQDRVRERLLVRRHTDRKYGTDGLFHEFWLPTFD